MSHDSSRAFYTHGQEATTISNELEDSRERWARPVIVFHAEIAVKQKAKTCITNRENMRPPSFESAKVLKGEFNF